MTNSKEFPVFQVPFKTCSTWWLPNFMDEFFMLKKHSVLFIALLSSMQLYAIPIESRGLSQQQANNVIAASPSLNWDIMQKNQKLEEDIRKLRGQLEEHENAIDQLNKELSNRYTDLDQRLELLS